jgi:outer membrane autotransporter protein
MDGGKGTLLLRTKDPEYYESVGGIGLDMTEGDIRAKYGDSDTILPRTSSDGIPDKANYRTGEQSLSIEHGRTLYRGKNRSFFIEPQVQLVLGHLNDTSYITERGTHVERDSLNSAIGRLGIVLGKTKDSGEHPYDYYLKASLLHEFGGSQWRNP